MKIINYDVDDDTVTNYKQIHPFMPNQNFRMLICGPSGSGKTNLLVDMICRPLLYYDKIYLYAKNLDQSKYKYLLREFISIILKLINYSCTDDPIRLLQFGQVHGS